LVIAVIDAISVRFTGQPLVQLTHVILLVGAVLAFLL